MGDWKAVPALPIRVEVGLALCKGSRFEDALEKLAELGAENVVPLLTERTERFSPSPSKTKRWTQIAHSSSALANRLIPMSLAPTTDFNSFLSQPSPAELIYAHPDGQTPQELFQAKPAHYRILIGPEGGFSPNELNALQTCRARCLSLGPLTLRVETAAVCATSFALMGSSSV